MKKVKFLILLLSVGFFMQACYPGGPEVTSDYDVTFATPKSNYDFGNKAQNTYVMPDTVIDITDPQEIKNPPKLSASLQSTILSNIKRNFGDYGYTELDDSQVNNADYIVFCQRLVTDNFVTYFWGGWGGYYPGWGYPGWGWGGYYPPSYTTYDYQTGTLFITMIDVATSDTTKEQINFVWDSGVNGLLGTSTSTTTNRVVNGIDKIFELSPYLNKK